MTHITLDVGEWKDLFSAEDPMRNLLEQVLNQTLEAERYERNKGRRAYRNGYRTRQLTTRIGTTGSPRISATIVRSKQWCWL